MLVLVEGVDKCGKTTLLSDLHEHLPGVRTFKNMIKPEDKSLHTIGRITGIYQGVYQVFENDELVLMDRSHITELVYSPRRGYSSRDHFNWRLLEDQLNACVIYMSAPIDVVSQRFKEDNETYVDVAEIDSLVSGYEEYLRNTDLSVLWLSSLDSRESNLIKAIKFIGDNKNEYNRSRNSKN